MANKTMMQCNNIGNKYDGGFTTLTAVLQDLAARFVLTCPIEEFESFERLFFQIEVAYWFFIDHYLEFNTSLPRLSLKEFSRRIFQECPMLTKFQSSVEAHLQEFSHYKVGVPVFGAIVLNRAMDSCLLVKGWSKNAPWGFPKGKVNKDESEVACACREVFEEVGFDISGLIKESDAISATIKHHENEQTIKLFIVSGVSEETLFETQTRHEISQICWFPVKDLPVSKEYGREFFLVRPFIKQLNAWIKEKKEASRHLKLLVRSKPVKESRQTASALAGRSKLMAGANSRLTNESQTLEELANTGGTFSVEDMFRVNEERFGVKSTYQFELYTTSLKSRVPTIANTTLSSQWESQIPGGSYRTCTARDVQEKILKSSSSTDSLRLPSSVASLTAAHRPSRSKSTRKGASSKSLENSKFASLIPNPNAEAPSHSDCYDVSLETDPSCRKYDSQSNSPRTVDMPGMIGSVFFSSEIEASMCSSCALDGNSEFGRGFRFNTLDVMAPLLAMG